MELKEYSCLYKLYSVAMGKASKNSITKEEINVAAECLKKIAENKTDWSDDEKNLYKEYVDICKEMSNQNEPIDEKRSRKT